VVLIFHRPRYRLSCTRAFLSKLAGGNKKVGMKKNTHTHTKHTHTQSTHTHTKHTRTRTHTRARDYPHTTKTNICYAGDCEEAPLAFAGSSGLFS
jgi:hypothetical protein